MPICIECCYPVSVLYTTYSKADDRTLGKGVRLTQCPRCKRFADKYVEHDFVVLFIDLVLIKPQVYRHLLFNRLGRDDGKFDRSIIRLGILTLLFDVYLSWARIENSSAITSSSLASAHIIVQYLFFLTLNTLATLAHHATVRLLAAYLVPRPNRASNGNRTGNITAGNGNSSSPPTPLPLGQPQTATPTPGSISPTKPLRSSSVNDLTHPPTPSFPPPDSDDPPPLRRASTAPMTIQPIPPPTPASPNAISTALLVSSCTKLFPILLVIWGNDKGDSTSSNGNRRTSKAVGATVTTSKTVSTARSSDLTNSTPPGMSASRPESSFLSSFIPEWWPSAPPAVQSFLSAALTVTQTHLVLLNNTEALFILLDCGYVRATSMALGGQLARWLVERAILSLVGL
ncbi:hypothetical protein VTO42DRAFT_1347 [Malbranchea cinnamomea]